MKKYCALFTMLIASVFLCSCAAGVSDAELTDTVPSSAPVIADSPIDLLPFYSLEEFIDAAKSISGEKDIAALASLESFSLPVGLPEEYKLYKISAGAMDIAFFYLPEELLEDENVTAEAEAAQKHFMLIDGRGNYDFDQLLNQFGGDRSQLVDGKYFVYLRATPMIIWEKNYNVYMLYCPAGTRMEASGEKAFADGIAALDKLESLCELEAINIK